MTRSRWRLAALAWLATGCGPSNEEVGVAILSVMPVAFLALFLPPLALRRLRDGPRDRDPDDLRLLKIGAAVACGFSILGIVRVGSSDWDGELVAITAAVVGSAGMLYGQLAWLIFDRHQRRFGRFALPTLVVTFAIPAMALAYGDFVGLRLSHDAGQVFALFVLAIPGYFFAPPAVLFLIACLVFVHRRRQAARLQQR